MKLIIVLLLLINPIDDLNKVAKINSLKKEAREAYNNGDFKKAVSSYERLVNEFAVTEESVKINLANAYYKNAVPEKARELYTELIASTDPKIQSTAYNQLGLLIYQDKKKEEAINFFKEALKANPANGEARFNYTKLKKEIEEEQKQQDQNKDQQNKDQKDNQQQEEKSKEEQQQEKEQQQKEQQEKEQQQQKGEQGEEENEQQDEQEKEQEQQQGEEEQQQSTAEKLQEMNMSEEKAQMILEAMKNNEVQYIQQNRKKPQSQSNDGRPDW